jgi:hypothetical protein
MNRMRWARNIKARFSVIPPHGRRHINSSTDELGTGVRRHRLVPFVERRLVQPLAGNERQ